MPLAPEKSEAEVVFTTRADDDAVLPADTALAEILATDPAAAAEPVVKFHVMAVWASSREAPANNATLNTQGLPRCVSHRAFTDAIRPTVESPTAGEIGRANIRSNRERVDMVQDHFSTQEAPSREEEPR